MTSQIVSETIDEDFPVAGQDNDSQGFRDNFNIIKTGLATAASEITVLQTSTAKLDAENDFNGNVISNAQTNRLYGTVYTNTTTSGLTPIDFANGEYQVINLDRNSSLKFVNWPAPTGKDVYSKIRVAFRTLDGGDYLATFITESGNLTPVQGASNSFQTGTNINVSQVVEAWTSDNGDTVLLATVGDFSTVATIADISDIGNVSVSAPVIGQVLKWNGTNWVNDTDAVGDNLNLTALSDVTITSPTPGQVLKYNGTQWANVTLDVSELSDTTNVIPTDLSNLTDTTNIIPADISDLTDTTNLLDDWKGSEQVVDASSVDLAKSAGYFVTGAIAEGAVLGAGVEGQIKVLVMKTFGGGEMVVNVTNPGWGGAGTITFGAAGRGCTLQYINSKWYCVGNNGAAFA